MNLLSQILGSIHTKMVKECVISNEQSVEKCVVWKNGKEWEKYYFRLLEHKKRSLCIHTRRRKWKRKHCFCTIVINMWNQKKNMNIACVFTYIYNSFLFVKSWLRIVTTTTTNCTKKTTCDEWNIRNECIYVCVHEWKRISQRWMRSIWINFQHYFHFNYRITFLCTTINETLDDCQTILSFYC